MSLIGIYNNEGIGLSVHSLNLFGLRLEIPAPSYSMTTESVDGMAGVVVTDKTLNSRHLTAEFRAKSTSYKDSLKLRDELFTIFAGNEIYVTETNNSGIRWKVHPLDWSPDRVNLRVQHFEVPLLAASGVAESINLINKSYNSTSFTFKNEGTQPIDMRVQNETQLTFTGASSGLSISNLTTGDTWTYSGSTIATDVVTLKGVRSLKNGQSIFKDTNKKLINIAIGNNDFQISGTTGVFTLEISTRFYFL